MKLHSTYQKLLFIIGLWMGFIAAISFMEAWLKFQAEGVTLPIGLAIGSLVFKALNLVEIVFSFLVLLLIFQKENPLLKRHRIGLFSLVIAVALQTIWLLPALDARVAIITAGGTVPDSLLHIFYVLIEIFKIIILSIIGLQILTQNVYKQS